MFGRLATNLLKGSALGLFIATGLTAWATLVHYLAGTAPFDRLHTSFPAVVAGYYLGGLTGGLLIGLAWPLRRWILGCVLLAVVGVFPFYLFAPGGRSGFSAIDQRTVATSLLGAVLIGPVLGIWAWADDHPTGPIWLDTLRYPSRRGLGWVWALAITVAVLSVYLVPLWSHDWPFTLVLLAAAALFVAPLATALLVTHRFFKGRGAQP